MKKNILFLIFVLLFNFPNPFLPKIFSQELMQQIESDFKEGRIELGQALTYKVLAIFDKAKLPAKYRDLSLKPQKCATPLIFEIKRQWDRLSPQDRLILAEYLSRPILSDSLISPSGKFKIHYTTQGDDAVPAEDLDKNNIPDFVEEAGRAFDYSWKVMIDSLAYKAPPPDFGIDGDQIDVYMQDMNAYGEAVLEDEIPSTPYDDYTSYMRIDNDFVGFYTPPLQALKVTAAHEFFHVVQLGYNFRYDQDVYFFEISSAWMEDVAYDEINDYYQYLPIFFQHPEIPFTSYSEWDYLISAHNLGTCLWNHFLTKKYGINCIRRIWQEILDYPSLEAMDNVLKAEGTSFGDEFVEFSIWNYFTGSRADSIKYYEEGANYPEINLEENLQLDSDTTVTGSSVFLTAKYYKFKTLVSDNFYLEMNFEDPYIWSTGAIIIPAFDGRAAAKKINPGGSGNLGFVKTFSDVVLIPTNLEIPEDPLLPHYKAKKSKYTYQIKRGYVELLPSDDVFANFPNPFIIGHNQFTTIPFKLAKISRAELNILSSDGRLIRKIELGECPDGYQTYDWDGTDDDGNFVSSGIYIYQLKTSRFTKAKKMAVIKK